MTDRDRLIELLKQVNFDFSEECIACCEDGYKATPMLEDFFADHLLANGVIVLPCYIGQEIWYLCEHYDGSVEIKKGKISMLQQKADKSWKFRITINSSVWDFKVDDIGVSYFLTKEEAEAELKKRGKQNEC